MGNFKNRISPEEAAGKECKCGPAACFGDKTQHNNGTITKIMDPHQVQIGNRAVARVGDIATYQHHSSSPIYQECLVTVLVGGKRVARLNDRLLCGCPNDDYIATGNPMVLIGGVSPEMPPPYAKPGKGEYVKVGYYHALNPQGLREGVNCTFNIYSADGATLLATAPSDPKGEALVELPEGTNRIIFEPVDLVETYEIRSEYGKKPNPYYQNSTTGWILGPKADVSMVDFHPEYVANEPLESWDEGSLGTKLSGALTDSAEWIWDVLSGDFAEDPSMGQIICRGVLYFIPFVGKALDAQDISACMYFMLWKGRYKEPMLWFMLVVTLIGCIPVVGDAAKLTLKALGKGGGKTVRSLLELFETLNLVGKGNGLKFLKKLADDLPGYGKIAADKITSILGFIADKLDIIKKWSLKKSKVYQKADAVLEILREMERMAGEMCAKITGELQQKLRGLLDNFKKQTGTAPTTKAVPEKATGTLNQEARAVDDRWTQSALKPYRGNIPKLGEEVPLEDALIQKMPGWEKRATNKAYGAAMAENTRALQEKIMSGEIKTYAEAREFMGPRVKELNEALGRRTPSGTTFGKIRSAEENLEFMTPTKSYGQYAERASELANKSGGIHTVKDSGITLTSSANFQNGLWFHTPADQLAAIDGKMEAAWQKALSAPTAQGRVDAVADFHWWGAHQMPYERGSAGAMDSMTKALLGANDIPVGGWKPEVGADLEAFVVPREEFVKNYSTFFE